MKAILISSKPIIKQGEVVGHIVDGQPILGIKNPIDAMQHYTRTLFGAGVKMAVGIECTKLIYGPDGMAA